MRAKKDRQRSREILDKALKDRAKQTEVEETKTEEFRKDTLSVLGLDSYTGMQMVALEHAAAVGAKFNKREGIKQDEVSSVFCGLLASIGWPVQHVTDLGNEKLRSNAVLAMITRPGKQYVKVLTRAPNTPVFYSFAITHLGREQTVGRIAHALAMAHVFYGNPPADFSPSFGVTGDSIDARDRFGMRISALHKGRRERVNPERLAEIRASVRGVVTKFD